jgi:hypothetical protein
MLKPISIYLFLDCFLNMNGAYKNGAKASYGGLIRGAKRKWLSSFSKNFKNVELNIDSKVSSSLIIFAPVRLWYRLI